MYPFWITYNWVFLNGVASIGKKKCLIQVTYEIKTEANFDREYGAFSKIKDGSPRYVMSLDAKDTSNGGVTHIYLPYFLLGKVDIALS